MEKPIDELTLTIDVLYAKSKALKAALNPEQLKLYQDSIAESKAAILNFHGDSSKSLHKRLEKLFH